MIGRMLDGRNVDYQADDLGTGKATITVGDAGPTLHTDLPADGVLTVQSLPGWIFMVGGHTWESLEFYTHQGIKLPTRFDPATRRISPAA